LHKRIPHHVSALGGISRDLVYVSVDFGDVQALHVLLVTDVLLTFLVIEGHVAFTLFNKEFDQISAIWRIFKSKYFGNRLRVEVALLFTCNKT